MKSDHQVAEDAVSKKTTVSPRLKKNQLFSLYLVLMMAIAVVTGGILFVVQSNTDAIIEDLIEERTHVANRALSEHIHSFRIKALERVESVASSPTVIKAINRHDQEVLQKILGRYAEDVDAAWIIDTDGAWVAATGTLTLAQGKIANTLKSSVPSARIYAGEDASLFILASTAVYDGEEIIGFAGGVVDLAQNSILDSFKIQYGYEATIFSGAVRINSTVVRPNGTRITGTAANKDITKNVIENKADYHGRVFVNQQTYQGYYSPIIAEGRAIGMLFSGADIQPVLTRQAKMGNLLVLLTIIALFMIGGSLVVLNRYTKLFSTTVDELSQQASSLAIVENILNELDSYLYVTDVETNEILFFNKTLREHFGLTDAVIGQKCWRVFFAGKEDRCAECSLPMLLNSNPDEKVIWRAVNPLNGRYYKHIDRLLDWPDGRKVHFCQRVDITQIKQALDKAESASLAKSLFLSRMSHEMRTPMNAIIGMAQLAAKEESADSIRSYLKRIDVSAGHLLSIINDVLDISAMESGEFKLTQTEFAIQELVDQIVAVMAFKIRAKRQELTITVADDVPLTITSDKQRLAQAVIHLLSNACKFTPQNGNIALRISKMDANDEGACYLNIEVEDDGIGLEEEKRAQIFSAFEQADNSINRQYGGTGLGLAITQHIALAMDGDVWVSPGAEKGSIFGFKIRVVEGSSRETVGTVEDGMIQKEDISQIFVGKHMLLVDDVDINREIMIGLLEETGITIDCAENGREACEVFAANPESYDVIIMDIHMPEMNGHEASVMIREMGLPNSETIPIIAMTADIYNQDLEKCLSVGMNDHLGKPLQTDIVIAKLKLHLLDS